MQVCVLGTVDVRDDDGASIVIRQAKLRQVICVLALADRVVASDELRTMVWDGTGTADTLSALTTTINRVRALLPEGRLSHEPGGYRLVLDRTRDYLDRRAFQDLMTQARAVRKTRPQRASELYQAALALWGDPLLGDLPDTPMAAALAQRLLIERRDAIEALAELWVRLGSHEELTRELPAHLEADPINERLWIAYLLGLYRDGRRAEALRTYQEAREVILAEAGTEPGAALAGMCDRIKKDDPSLNWRPNVSAHEHRAVAAGIDPNVVSQARLYDYILGGKNNFAVDRQVGDRVLAQSDVSRVVARANRAFLREAVTMLAEQGITQFLDIGTGLPTQGSVHEIAHAVNPDVHVVYVDYDPMVVAHGKALIDDSRNVSYVLGDILEPAQILNDPQTRRLIDPSEPVAILMLMVLHFCPADDAHLALEAYRAWMAQGSALVISHLSRDDTRPEIIRNLKEQSKRSTIPIYLRSRPEIEVFFAGLDLISPLDDPAAFRAAVRPAPRELTNFAGIGIKP